MEAFLDGLRFTPDGLIPCVVQDHANGQVLMFAWMNREALRRTLAEGRMVYWSRSRQKFWVKGETSGHAQRLVRLSFDCDGDALLVQVEQTGAACHEGYRSCFFRDVGPSGDVTENAERVA